MKSDHRPKDNTFGGVFSLAGVDKPGIYQVTASEEAWIEVSPDGKSVARALAHSGMNDCPGLRKSVRFEINGPASIQISNAASPTIDLAIAPAD